MCIRDRVSTQSTGYNFENSMSEKTVLVPVGEGSEEIESVCIIDTLRRAGANVTVASVESNLEVTCSRQVKIVADALIGDCKDKQYDLIVLPGGMPGAERLRDCAVLKEMLIKQKSENRFYGAICASPAVVLQHHGLIDDREATCYPNEKFVDVLPKKTHLEDRIVVSGNCFTSRGPGTAIEFALKLIEHLYGKEKAETIQKQMLVSSY
eukprot:TRINITY_DN16303_c0_g1_i1.p1 TRINITY_DN16303_c0_g1~~TRINITY_DN16303_c0_g1_i1.p1  ORF type:complete len:209 (+),score=45.56 TRINITY_DN16303_c0_g1_i1:1-627(+)